MPEEKLLGLLFQQRPQQWNLRGDPHLWNELLEVLGNQPYPDTEEALRSLLEQTFLQLAGVTLSHNEPIFIERHSHGGMSSGYILPTFWANTVIPLLLEHYRSTR